MQDPMIELSIQSARVDSLTLIIYAGSDDRIIRAEYMCIFFQPYYPMMISVCYLI